MVDSRAKGARGETIIRDILRKHTSLSWERVPSSGALDPKHGLKGDLYVPNEKNYYVVEVKNYEEDHLTSKLLTSKSPQLLEFWKQALRQGEQVAKEPLLMFKFDRSKVFVACRQIPNDEYSYIFVKVGEYELYISLLEEWLENEKPKFT